MPADSEPAAADRPVALPHTWRPLGTILAGGFFGLMFLIVCVAMWVTFDAEVRASVTFGQRLTLLGFIGLGCVAMYALMRCRVTATADKVVIVNGFKVREYAWPQLVTVTLTPGSPWATVDLADGTSVPAMGIQGSDGARAHRAVRELRALLEG